MEIMMAVVFKWQCRTEFQTLWRSRHLLFTVGRVQNVITPSKTPLSKILQTQSCAIRRHVMWHLRNCTSVKKLTLVSGDLRFRERRLIWLVVGQTLTLFTQFSVPSTGRDQLKSDLWLDPKISFYSHFPLKPIILGMMMLSKLNSIT